MAILLSVLILEATRRCVAKELSIISIIFLLYGYFGYLMPGVFHIRGGSIARLVNHIYMIPEGIFGTCLGTSANYIVLFVIFGAFLEKSGLGSLIQDIAIELTGRYAGGPAKVAVLSSALFGTVSGSAAANVVTTGAFTIPLMKRIGYEPEFAAAVEACSSTGGQIVPPVMGTAAFLMADYIGMPYKYIMLAAILPCILYYFSIFVAVHVPFPAGTGVPHQNSSGPFPQKVPELFFTSLHGACQNRRDLHMGTGSGGVEASAAHADGNAVLHGPRHRACVVVISVLPVLIEGLLKLLTPQNPPLCIGGWATLSQPSVNSHTAAQLQ